MRNHSLLSNENFSFSQLTVAPYQPFRHVEQRTQPAHTLMSAGESVMLPAMTLTFLLTILVFWSLPMPAAQQAALPIQDGQIIPLWQGRAPGVLGTQDSDVPVMHNDPVLSEWSKLLANWLRARGIVK